MSEPVRIGPETRVTLHFTLRLAGGDVVDSTVERAPATFLVGDGSLLPAFEQALFGLKAGDRRSVVIDPANGFGDHNPENVREIDRSLFSPGLALERGLMVSFADGKGELPGVVLAVGDDKVTVDFNHPLAGRDLDFDVEIIAVEGATPAVPVILRDPHGGGRA